VKGVPLSRRALNRATLDRQLLLRRHPSAPLEAVRHLAGLQAQAPQAPYLGLWTRLSDFSPEAFSDLLTSRTVLRAQVMRATVHVVDAADYRLFRGLFQPLMERVLMPNFGPNLTGVDLAELASLTSEHLTEQPRSRADLAKLLAKRWPDNDPMSLANAATFLVPVVQIPPRGLWRRTGAPVWADARSWLGGELSTRSDALDQLVLRYLAAFGPATVADIRTWSGLTRLHEVTGRLDLGRYEGEDGATLWDLPGLSLPDPDVPAPPRFLPEYDNLLLSHADRSRVIPHRRAVPLPPGNGATTGTVLIDGEWNAGWKLTRDKESALVTVSPYVKLTAPVRDAVTAEALSMLAFLAPDHAHDVRIEVP
jgi:hypothetical protein